MRPALAALVLAGIIALPAAAQTLREARFAGDTSCYLRQYDRAHLASHPVQQVTMIALGPDVLSAEAFSGEDLRLKLAFSLRSGATYSAVAYCTDKGAALDCALESDGGSFTLDAAKNGALRLSVTGFGLIVEGEADFAEISALRGDDKVFVLPPVSAAACP